MNERTNERTSERMSWYPYHKVHLSSLLSLSSSNMISPSRNRYWYSFYHRCHKLVVWLLDSSFSVDIHTLVTYRVIRGTWRTYDTCEVHILRLKTTNSRHYLYWNNFLNYLIRRKWLNNLPIAANLRLHTD